MDRDHSRSNVWPYRQYDGGDRYEEYVVDKDTWIIEKGFKKQSKKADSQYRWISMDICDL